ncbi:MAG: glycosyltransferase family 39 protein [Chloroflexi bacterium]|nr:glycosyltransferase family 39 protein [Chloroflexota bacterium]
MGASTRSRFAFSRGAYDGTTIAVLLVALCLRAFQLSNDLTGDEGFTCSLLMNDFAGIVRDTLALGEPHPVGYYFVLKAWTALAGNSEFAQRSLSMWFGVLAVALIAMLSRQIVPGARGRFVALVAAALMALSSFTVSQSRDMRMYSMLLATTIASTSLMLYAVGSRRRSTWLAYVLVSGIAIQTHYYALFVLVAQNLYVGSLLLLRRVTQARPLLTWWAAAQLGIVAITVPWLILVRDVLLSYQGFGTMPSLPDALIFALSVFGAGPYEHTQPVLFAAIGGMLAVVALVKLWLHGPRQRDAALLLSLYVLIPVLAIWLLSQSRPVFKDRYLIAAVAPFHILLAIAAVPLTTELKTNTASAKGRILTFARIGMGMLLAYLLVAGIIPGLRNYIADQISNSPKSYPALRKAFDQYSGGFAQEQLRWVVNYPDYGFTCYLGTPKYTVLPSRAGDQQNADAIAREFRDAGVRRVLLNIVEDVYWDGRGIASSALAKEFTQIKEVFAGRWPVKIFSRINEDELRMVGATFANNLMLDAAAVYPDVLGRLLEVHLKWLVSEQSLTDGEKLFIHVMRTDAPDHLVTQLDVPFTADDTTGQVRTFGVPLPESLPQGTYQVFVGLYNSEQPGMPRIPTTTGADKVEIDRFSVP